MKCATTDLANKYEDNIFLILIFILISRYIQSLSYASRYLLRCFWRFICGDFEIEELHIRETPEYVIIIFFVYIFSFGKYEIIYNRRTRYNIMKYKKNHFLQAMIYSWKCQLIHNGLIRKYYQYTKILQKKSGNLKFPSLL